MPTGKGIYDEDHPGKRGEGTDAPEKRGRAKEVPEDTPDVDIADDAQEEPPD